MDGDPAVEQQLDIFSLILPLPYRVAIIFTLGVWAWALNLHYLSVLRIDVANLIKYPSRISPSGPPHHLRVYRVATILSIPLIISLVLFWLITHGRTTAVVAWDILPQFYLFFIVVFFVVPFQRPSKGGRYRFLATLKRISIGGIASTQDGKFGDILLADALTSYAKVLGDLFVSGCMFFSPSHSSTAKPDRSCGGLFIVPLIISIPSLIRLRQCLTEYLRVRRSMHSTDVSTSSGWGGQHLANALKYLSALPVTILSALLRNNDSSKLGMSEVCLFRLWFFFVLLNSFYSFYWDVAKDWDLTLFADKRERNNPNHAWGLRPHTHFHAHGMYYAAIVVDFVLRCTWSLKLSPHLDHFNDLEGGIFTMEILEVGRRWMWIFFRVETEWVRTQRVATANELLLVDYDSERNLEDRHMSDGALANKHWNSTLD